MPMGVTDTCLTGSQKNNLDRPPGPRATPIFTLTLDFAGGFKTLLLDKVKLDDRYAFHFSSVAPAATDCAAMARAVMARARATTALFNSYGHKLMQFR